MRWSKSLISTLRNDPQEAEITSHKLLLRAGLIYKLSGGLYTFTPLGIRVLHKVEQIIREEMNRAGAQEILMPALQPIDIWEISGRATQMGGSMFRLKDRQGREMVLGPTHEEVVTDFITHAVSSYRQLPCTVYQIQTKFRDEIRPRAKEFIMKDAYSFDVSDEAADISYQSMYDAYVAIFKRCGLIANPVEADTGNIGGSHSHEFMVLAPTGEDGILSCKACNYAANQERAERRTAGSPYSTPDGSPTEVPTPDARTVPESAQAVGVSNDQIVKSMIYLADGKPVMALVAGTREINECKLRRIIGCSTLDMANDEVTAKHAGPFGSIGPIGVKIPVYADLGLKGARNVVVGANKADCHIKHVSLDEHVTITDWVDIITVEAEDCCPKCGEPLRLARGIEVGHVFKLGTKYTEAFNATFLDSEKQSNILVMGCYGIGVTRTVQAIVEQNADANGIIWPASVSPCQVTLLPLDAHKDERCRQTADALENDLEAIGIDVLVDDRDERPGVKFKDADLIGCSLRIVIGTRSLEKNVVEVRVRKTGETMLIPISEAVETIRTLLNTLTQND